MFNKISIFNCISISYLIFIFSFSIQNGGTFDSGDSIQHYLMSRFSMQHSELFFNPWAKPVFVFLSFPFAQFGFIGIQIFNLLVSFFTLFLCQKLAIALGIHKPWMAILLLAFSTLFGRVAVSGLTEPLFGMLLMVVLNLLVLKKWIPGIIVLSFLPYARSEGWILVVAMLPYLLLQSQIKKIPLLFMGTIIFGFAGRPWHDSIFWPLLDNPYGTLSSTYGSGDPFHFITQLLYVSGIPLYMLFWIGFLFILLYFQKKENQFYIFVLMPIVFSFIMAHSVFWYFGIFNSMGLNRVLACILPCCAIIGAFGLEKAWDLFSTNKWPRLIFRICLIAGILIFPITGNKAAIHWESDFSPGPEQTVAHEVFAYCSPLLTNHTRFIFSMPFLDEVFSTDPFNPNIRQELNQENLSGLRKGDILVWDSWFSVVEKGFSKEDLLRHSNIQFLFEFEKDGKEMAVFTGRIEFQTARP